MVTLQNSSLIYEKSSLGGMVSLRYVLDGDQILCYFDDGDISSSVTRYGVLQDKEKFVILETGDLSTPLDGLLGKSPFHRKTVATDASSLNEARQLLVEYIVQPIERQRSGNMGIDAKELRTGLEKALVSN